MMGLVYPGIYIQTGIDHDPVDEVIDDGGDVVHTAESIVEAGRMLCGHWCILRGQRKVADRFKLSCGGAD
jgi:hypothetical protein